MQLLTVIYETSYAWAILTLIDENEYQRNPIERYAKKKNHRTHQRYDDDLYSYEISY